MQHLEPDRMVLIALGEQAPSAGEAEHLDNCTACGADLASTRTVAGIGRDARDLRELPPPPEAVWDRIAGEAFTKVDTRAEVPEAAPRSNRRSYALVAAVAAIVGVGAAVAVQQARRDDSPRVVAEADLTPQKSAPPGAHGTAEIVDTGHGLQMRVSVSGMPATAGYYTVWLYDGGNVMIPIGSPGSGALNLPPAATDLTRFRIVDISAQRLGQQEHGTSMLQGKLGG